MRHLNSTDYLGNPLFLSFALFDVGVRYPRDSHGGEKMFFHIKVFPGWGPAKLWFSGSGSPPWADIRSVLVSLNATVRAVGTLLGSAFVAALRARK